METTFQPLSRGLIPHLQYLSDAGTKLYIYSLMMVRATGENRGKFNVSTFDLCTDLSWERKKFYKVAKQLDSYLTIKMPPNQHDLVQIEVQDYSGRRL